jgi:hypothetical protein
MWAPKNPSSRTVWGGAVLTGHEDETGQHPSAHGGETAALSSYSNHVVGVGLCGQFLND